MGTQSEPVSSNISTITLEVVPEDPQQADPALVDAIGRDTIDALRNKGYTIEPVYTGQRGGVLVAVLIPFLIDIWTSKDIILADGSALVTIMTPIVIIIQHLREAHEKRVGNEAFQKTPIKITVEINGNPISVETPDLQTAEGAMILARRFLAQHPGAAVQMTSQSQVKITGSVPKRLPRKRR